MDVTQYRIRFLAVVVGCLLFPLIGLAQQSGERIRDFHSDITVNADASLLVRETIAVQSMCAEIKHGIYRDYPLSYRSKKGAWVNTGFEVVDVRRDGQPEPYHIKRQSGRVLIYMGNSQVILPPGRYAYTLTYRVTNAVTNLKACNQLYWNITGNEWTYPIDHASATVTLPESVPDNAVTLTGYTGRYGVRGNDYSAARNATGACHFSTTAPLDSGEGLTIMVDFPKNTVAQAVRRAPVTWFAKGDPAFRYALLGLAAVFGYYLLVWLCIGRDPAKGTIIPRFAPPEGLSPAAVRYLWKMAYDDKVLAVALINLAVKGVVSIVRIDRDFRVKREETVAWDPQEQLLRELKSGIPIRTPVLAKRLGLSRETVDEMLDTLIRNGVFITIRRDTVRMDPGQSLNLPKHEIEVAPEEARVLRDLIGPSLALDFNGASYEFVQETIKNLKATLAGKYEARYFAANSLFLIPGILLSLFTIGYVTFGDFTGIMRDSMATAPSAPRDNSIFLGLYLPIYLFAKLVAPPIIIALIMFIIRAIKCNRGPLHYIVLGTLLALPIGFTAYLHVKYALFNHFPLAFFASILLLWGVNLLFYHLLKAPSQQGRKLLDQIEGFRMYLSVAERDTFKRMNPPEQTPALFEKYLPYAVALDVEHAWAERFTQVLSEAQIGGMPYQPAWYSGNDLRDFQLVEFADSLGSLFQESISSSTIGRGETPDADTRQDGFSGGGGSSGGGGGGGGGGGW